MLNIAIAEVYFLDNKNAHILISTWMEIASEIAFFRYAGNRNNNKKKANLIKKKHDMSPKKKIYSDIENLKGIHDCV